MARFIKDPTGLTFGDLQNNDWDLIELNITVDIAAAMEWVNEVQIKNQDCVWAWSDVDQYVDEERLEYFINQGFKEFGRKDYMNVFKDISSATASRDLKKGIELNLFESSGNLNKTKYHVK